MDVGKINDKFVNNTINETKNKVAADDFEKRLQNAYDKNDEKELKKVCQEFEGIMLDMMYKQMKATVPKSDLIPEDTGKEIFDSMLDDELVNQASKNSKLGLGDMLYKQMSKQLKSTYKPGNGGGNTEGAEKK